jgi:hypothetical protein
MDNGEPQHFFTAAEIAEKSRKLAQAVAENQKF